MEPTLPSAPIKTTKAIAVAMKTANAYSARIDIQSRKLRVRVSRLSGGVPSWGGISVAAGTQPAGFAQRLAESSPSTRRPRSRPR